MFNNYPREKSKRIYESQQANGLKIFTRKQLLETLPIALAQINADNNSESLLNKIRQIAYSLYQSVNWGFRTLSLFKTQQKTPNSQNQHFKKRKTKKKKKLSKQSKHFKKSNLQKNTLKCSPWSIFSFFKRQVKINHQIYKVFSFFKNRSNLIFSLFLKY